MHPSGWSLARVAHYRGRMAGQPAGLLGLLIVVVGSLAAIVVVFVWMAGVGRKARRARPRAS